MKYTVTLQEMTAQTTVGGKTKLDGYGNPLKSIRIKQSYEQRQEMIGRMSMLYDLWKSDPKLWDNKKHLVGNDPRKYTAEEMFTQFHNRIKNWKFSNGDIYKQFEVRHNFLLDQFIMELHKTQSHVDDLIELAEYNCRIELQERNERITKLRSNLMSNPLFEFDYK